MIVYCGVSPHPPLIIPEIGGVRIKKVQETVNGLRRMARFLVDTCPEVVVFFTPHGNVFSDCISVLSEPELQGDFSDFGLAVTLKAKNHAALLHEMASAAAGQSISLLLLDREKADHNRLKATLDHGILVPLYYLRQAGLSEQVPVIPISIGFIPVQDLYRLGKIIQEIAKRQQLKVAVVASGDLSHRLKDQPPYDFHPQGPEFDAMVKQYLEQKDVQALLDMEEGFRRNAGECGYCSLVGMLGALDGLDFESEVFSYEGPLGVGYLTAGLFPISDTDSLLEIWRREEQDLISALRDQESLPVQWARMVLESKVKNGSIPDLPKHMQELIRERAGVFVSLKKAGQLRGCIGTIRSAYGNLSEEIAANAVSAATQDTRFLPVSANELEQLVYSVDILEVPEDCQKEDLDPYNYGIIVESKGKRALLLPDLEGIETAEQQLRLVLQKGHISPKEEYRLQRFKVRRYY